MSRPGDRIGFEVLSSESGTAYLTVEDKKGVSLIDPMNVLESKISLQAGESKAFDFSITLSEENEGEVVTVYICKPGLENLSEEKLSNMFIQCLPSKFILR